MLISRLRHWRKGQELEVRVLTFVLWKNGELIYVLQMNMIEYDQPRGFFPLRGPKKSASTNWSTDEIYNVTTFQLGDLLSFGLCFGGGDCICLPC